MMTLAGMVAFAFRPLALSISTRSAICPLVPPVAKTRLSLLTVSTGATTVQACTPRTSPRSSMTTPTKSTSARVFDALLRLVIAAESVHEDVAEFIRRLSFNTLIGNGDMHLKNLSLTYPDDRHARLSPAYDFIDSPLHSRRPVCAELQPNEEIHRLHGRSTPAFFCQGRPAAQTGSRRAPRNGRSLHGKLVSQEIPPSDGQEGHGNNRRASRGIADRRRERRVEACPGCVSRKTAEQGESFPRVSDPDLNHPVFHARFKHSHRARRRCANGFPIPDVERALV